MVGMVDIDALIAKARESFDTVEPVDQAVELGGELVTIRLWPLTGTEWRGLTAKHPPREGVVFDQNVGYNLPAVLAEYPKVYAVQGDDVVNVTDKWAGIVEVLSAPDLRNLESAVWGLNEFDPQKRLAAAGKVSAGGRKRKRSSPASSA